MPVRFHSALAGMMVPIDRLSPDPRNFNNGDLDAISESVLVNGCYRPIYIDASGTIVAGHHLYHALVGLGETEVPVQVVDGGRAEVTRILVGDNEIARLAWRDDALLVNLLKELQHEEIGLYGTGVSDEGLALLLASTSNGFAPPPKATNPWPHQCPSCGHEWIGPCQPEGDQ